MVCATNSFEITLWTSVVLLYIVWPYYMLFALAIWVIASWLDMLLGSLKSKIVFDNFDSRILWLSLFKRGVIFSMGLFMTVVAWHFSSILDSTFWRITIWLLPAWYFHLFTLQEITSLFEHWVDIDPNNRATKVLKKVLDKTKQNLENQINSKIKDVTDMLYRKLSPIKNKLHLNRAHGK